MLCKDWTRGGDGEKEGAEKKGATKSQQGTALLNRQVKKDGKVLYELGRKFVPPSKEIEFLVNEYDRNNKVKRIVEKIVGKTEDGFIVKWVGYPSCFNPLRNVQPNWGE